MTERMNYKDAGVDIHAGEQAVDRIKSIVRSTFTSEVLTDLGKFGGFFSLDKTTCKEPVLVSSIDGVGTKLRVAAMAGKHDTVGEDLVNHCVNDILVGGARPLFFLDYIGTGILDPGVIEQIIAGMVRGCRQSGCALIGGEMAEMPGFYGKGDYDVVGCVVGLVDKEEIIDGRTIEDGDILVGLPSEGLHTNGYSLARKVLFEKQGLDVGTFDEDLGRTVGEELLRVHRCYLSVVSQLLGTIEIRGMAHITGGGLEGNTNRIVPEGLCMDLDWKAWEPDPIFKLIQRLGKIEDVEMRRTFNLGVGFVFVVHPSTLDQLLGSLKSYGENPVIIGRIRPS